MGRGLGSGAAVGWPRWLAEGSASGNLILGVLRLEPNFLLLRLEIDLNLGFVTGTWVGLETDGLGGSAGESFDRKF